MNPLTVSVFRRASALSVSCVSISTRMPSRVVITRLMQLPALAAGLIDFSRVLRASGASSLAGQTRKPCLGEGGFLAGCLRAGLRAGVGRGVTRGALLVGLGLEVGLLVALLLA